MRRLRQGRGGLLAARRATALQPAMAFDDWFDLRKIDFVLFTDHRARFIFSKRQAAMEAMRRPVIFNDVRLFGEVAGMPLVAMLRAAGTRTLHALPFGRSTVVSKMSARSYRDAVAAKAIAPQFSRLPALALAGRVSQSTRHGAEAGNRWFVFRACRPKRCSFWSKPK